MWKKVSVVVIIIAVVAVLGVSLPSFTGVTDEVKVNTSRTHLDAMVHAINAFEKQENKVITSIEELIPKYYAEKTADAWGKPYTLDAVQRTVKAYGLDHLPGTADDLVYSFGPIPETIMLKDPSKSEFHH